jgi:hypothetical protein
MPTLNVKAYKYVFPVKADVTVIDNTFWAKGDVNRDGVIDAVDLARITSAFGKAEGEPGYDPDCDLNGDGKVDMRDSAIAARNQGLTAPKYTTPFTTEVATGRCVLHCKYKTQTLKTELEMADTKKVIFLFLTLFSKTVIR